MKRQFKTYKGSISSLFLNKEPKVFAKQTIKGLFRVLLETTMEQNEQSTVLFKSTETKNFSGVLSRLEHNNNIETFSYCNSFPFSFKTVEIQNKNLKDDEFLIIISERFSICIYWKEIQNNIVEFYSSLNGEEIFSIIEYLQNQSKNQKLENILSGLKMDRRQNKNINDIFSKLIELNDEVEKELMCMDLKIDNSSKDNMSYSTIAHELRTPISIIDLNSNLLKKYFDKNISDTELKEKAENFYQAIQKSIFLLNEIANNLSAFSKDYKLNLSKENLDNEINTAINMLSAQTKEKQIEIIKTNDSGISEIKLDKIMFSRALLNLIKNALEASKENGKIFIEILKIKDYLLIKIEDNGIGIKEENQNKLFTPFFTTKKTGTGIGLYESRKIIQAHNGDLKLISTGDTGSTFGIFLPIN